MQQPHVATERFPAPHTHAHAKQCFKASAAHVSTSRRGSSEARSQLGNNNNNLLTGAQHEQKEHTHRQACRFRGALAGAVHIGGAGEVGGDLQVLVLHTASGRPSGLRSWARSERTSCARSTKGELDRWEEVSRCWSLSAGRAGCAEVCGWTPPTCDGKHALPGQATPRWWAEAKQDATFRKKMRRTLNTRRRPVVLKVARPGVALEVGGRVTANENGSDVCSNSNWRARSGGRLPAGWRVGGGQFCISTCGSTSEGIAVKKVPAAASSGSRRAGSAAVECGVWQHRQANARRT